MYIFLGNTQSDNEANMILIIFLLEMVEFAVYLNQHVIYLDEIFFGVYNFLLGLILYNIEVNGPSYCSIGKNGNCGLW